MFTRTEAIDFALERGLEGANFVYRSGDVLQIYYSDGCLTCLGRNHDRVNISTSSFPDGRLAEVLAGRGDGWFVSAKVDGEWFWHFDSETKVPHKEVATITV